MLRRTVAVLAGRFGLVGVLVCGALAFAGTPAQASALNEVRVSGVQTDVSCLSSKLCVLAGCDNHGVGDLIPLLGGVPGRLSTVAGTQGIYGVSCPSASGCVALGRTSNDIGAMLISINGSGLLTKTVSVKVPSGVTLDRIACTGVHSCEVAGTDIFVSHAVEVGSWNGHTLSLHRVGAPAGSTDTVVEGVSCSGTACEVVGYAEKVAVVKGLIVTISHGKPTGLHVVPGDSLYGVSCTSATLCYASGFNQSGGLILTVKRGVASAPAHVASDLSGIACRGTACTAVGEQLPPPPTTAAFYGSLVTVSSGKVIASQLVPASGGYNSVAAARGGFFAAVGSAQGAGSEVTTG
jgi:hypothetical protein